jgi:REP element-mobilizing transposase RayT
MDGEMRLNEIGKIVEKCWEEIPRHFMDVELDEYVIMPNHFHGIIILNEQCRGEVTSPLQKPTLGKVIAYFKYQSTKLINEIHAAPGNRFWQRSYYEHIIRSDKELNNIREYIVNNPMQWNVDEENPMKDEKFS